TTISIALIIQSKNIFLIFSPIPKGSCVVPNIGIIPLPFFFKMSMFFHKMLFQKNMLFIDSLNYAIVYISMFYLSPYKLPFVRTFLFVLYLCSLNDPSFFFILLQSRKTIINFFTFSTYFFFWWFIILSSPFR